MSARKDLKPMATPLEHLGHEWKAIEAASLIEGRQDFILGANLDPIASG
jgi:hypothetical protein